MQPLRVIIAGDNTIEAAVALSDRGAYVPVDVRNINTDVTETNQNDSGGDDDGSGVRLYQSIYETGLRNNVPSAVIEELVRIYSYDVDFQRKVLPGDSFDVLYADEETKEGGSNEVRYVSLTVGGETKKYYHYQTADNGTYDYYDETGKSAKKFLVRKPVPIGIMRSGFGERNHPLLHYMKTHTGVDWAAPFGTPIFAAGNGEIDEIGLKGRLRQICPHSPRQRLPDRLRPYDCLRARPRRRHPRASGPDHRLCRLDRPLNRFARAF